MSSESEFLLSRINELESRVGVLSDYIDYLSDIINKKLDDDTSIDGIDIKILEQYIRKRKIKLINEKKV